MRTRDRQLDLFLFELLIAASFVWLRWGWDAALLSLVGLIAVFTLLARLGTEARHWVCTVMGGAWGFAAAFVLVSAKASAVTCAIFAPTIAAIGYAIHFVALERMRAQQAIAGGR
jgi:hypothetical protein